MSKCKNCFHALSWDYGEICSQCNTKLIEPHWKHRQGGIKCSCAIEGGVCNCSNPVLEREAKTK